MKSSIGNTGQFLVVISLVRNPVDIAWLDTSYSVQSKFKSFVDGPLPPCMDRRIVLPWHNGKCCLSYVELALLVSIRFSEYRVGRGSVPCDFYISVDLTWK